MHLIKSYFHSDDRAMEAQVMGRINVHFYCLSFVMTTGLSVTGIKPLTTSCKETHGNLQWWTKVLGQM